LSWVEAGNVQITDKADLDIHTAATLCAFGVKTSLPAELLSAHIETDWRATVLMAEATSLTAWEKPDEVQRLGKAYSLCNQALKLMSRSKADRESVMRAIDDMLSWQDHWFDSHKNMVFRELAMEINTRNNGGLLSHKMVYGTLATAVLVNGIDDCFEIFKSFYESHRDLLLETFVYHADKACNSFMHLALSYTIANDADGVRFSTLCEVYRNSRALCAGTDVLSEQQKTLTELKLGFWLGRLNFLQSTHSKLDEAIGIWENLIQDLLRSPATTEIELMLPIVTHLCSAYVQKVLKGPGSPNSIDIVARVIRLVEIGKTSKAPLFVKLQFRTSLCLARIHIAQGNKNEAHKVLQEPSTRAFAMISQRYEKSLSNIGWFYLASILTVLGQEVAARVWTKVQMPQCDRRTIYEDWDVYEEGNANLIEDLPVDENTYGQLKAIEKGEYFTPNESPDDHYLPSYASMACDGRQCDSKSLTAGTVSRTHCSLLGSLRQPKDYWVCRDCVSTMLCFTCRGLLVAGTLPLMGCQASHEGVTVKGSSKLSEDDFVTIAKLRRDWEV
jgi:hypothetical protein